MINKIFLVGVYGYLLYNSALAISEPTFELRSIIFDFENRPLYATLSHITGITISLVACSAILFVVEKTLERDQRKFGILVVTHTAFSILFALYIKWLVFDVT